MRSSAAQKLDDALLLDSTNFRLHCAKIYADFAQSPSRPPLGAGTLYPTGVDDLIKGLESAFAAPNGPGLAVPETAGKAPRAMLLPSVEIKSGGPAYAWALKPLLDAAEFPTLIVLLGCDHGAADPMLTLTRKHYQTPIGELQTDVELVDAIIADATAKSTELGELVVRDEFHHRNEHSLELLAIWLRFVLDQRKKRGRQKMPIPKVVPVLCGSLRMTSRQRRAVARTKRRTRGLWMKWCISSSSGSAKSRALASGCCGSLRQIWPTSDRALAIPKKSMMTIAIRWNGVIDRR